MTRESKRSARAKRSKTSAKMLRRERDPNETANILERYDSLNRILDPTPPKVGEEVIEEEPEEDDAVDVVEDVVNHESIKEVDVVADVVNHESIKEVDVVADVVNHESIKEVDVVEDCVNHESIKEVDVVEDCVNHESIKEVDVVEDCVNHESIKEVDVVADVVNHESIKEVDVVEESQEPKSTPLKEEERVLDNLLEKDTPMSQAPKSPPLDSVEEEIPQTSASQEPLNTDKIVHNEVFPNRKSVDPIVPRQTILKEEGPSAGLLGSPFILYGAIGLASLLILFFLFRKSSPNPNTSNPAPGTGPIIVDVTETAGKEAERSIKNSVNRVSSPRIVFGDLRKNPSLMVAPPMTPAHSN
jgi:hypothetical protein